MGSHGWFLVVSSKGWDKALTPKLRWLVWVQREDRRLAPADVMMRTLKWLRWGIGSQWRLRSTGVCEKTCSRILDVLYFLECSGWRTREGDYCSPDVLNAWIRVSAAEKERDGWRRAVFLRWRNAVLVFDVLVKGEGWIRDDTKVTMAPSTVEPSV